MGGYLFTRIVLILNNLCFCNFLISSIALDLYQAHMSCFSYQKMHPKILEATAYTSKHVIAVPFFHSSKSLNSHGSSQCYCNNLGILHLNDLIINIDIIFRLPYHDENLPLKLKD